MPEGGRKAGAERTITSWGTGTARTMGAGVLRGLVGMAAVCFRWIGFFASAFGVTTGTLLDAESGVCAQPGSRVGTSRHATKTKVGRQGQ
jgi:hypothetical protein